MTSQPPPNPKKRKNTDIISLVDSDSDHDQPPSTSTPSPSPTSPIVDQVRCILVSWLGPAPADFATPLQRKALKRTYHLCNNVRKHPHHPEYREAKLQRNSKLRESVAREAACVLILQQVGFCVGGAPSQPSAEALVEQPRSLIMHGDVDVDMLEKVCALISAYFDENPKRRKLEPPTLQPVFLLNELLGSSQPPPVQHKHLAIGLGDLLGCSEGMERAVIINYLMEPELILHHKSLRAAGRIDVLLNAHVDPQEYGRGVDVKFNLWRVKSPVPFGVCHAKLFLFFYRTGVRVVISTSNNKLIDWASLVQGVWVQDFPKKDVNAPSADVPLNDFGEYLGAFLKDMKLRAAGCDADLDLSPYDFSLATAQLVGSVPGTHRGRREMRKWGLGRLRSLLEQYPMPDYMAQQTSAVAQCSSLGSLTPKYLNSLGSLFSTAQGRLPRDATLRLIWPTVEDVRTSVRGYEAGGSLPLNSKNNKPFLTEAGYLSRWECRLPYFQERTPHIKSYMWVDPDEESNEAAWVVVTSHNVSKAAWGAFQKNSSQLAIRHYELGMLFHPLYLQGVLTAAAAAHPDRVAFSCTPSTPLPPSVLHVATNLQPGGRVRLFVGDSAQPSAASFAASADIDRDLLLLAPLPFNPHPRQYENSDEPYVCDVAYNVPDSLGRVVSG